MLTFRVVASRHSDRSAPCSPLPATLDVTKSPVVHPLSIQQVTKCLSRNSFGLKTIHLSWGMYYPLLALPHDRHPLDCLSPIPYPLCIHILPHSFALFCTHQKLNSLLFSDSALNVEQRPGVGYSHQCPRGSKSIWQRLTPFPMARL